MPRRYLKRRHALSAYLQNIVFSTDKICKISYSSIMFLCKISHFTNHFCIFAHKITSIWLTKGHWNSSSLTSGRKWRAEPMRHCAKGVGMFDCFCSAKIRSHPYQAEGVDASFLKAQQFLLFSCRYNNMGF